MAIIRKRTSVRLNYRSVEITKSLRVGSGVGAVQIYDGGIATYEPNYELVPLLLIPEVSIYDYNGIHANGSVIEDSALQSIKWSKIVSGVETEITSEPFYGLASGVSPKAGCQVFTATDTDLGITRGTLAVHENVEPGSATTYVFTAVYYDSTKGETHQIRMEHLVQCESATSMPVVAIDAPNTIFWNPMSDIEQCTVTARFTVGGKTPDASKFIAVWEAKDSNTDWHEVGTLLSDFFAKVSADGMSVTVKYELMGAGTRLRVRVKYDPSGAPSSVTLDAQSPTAQVRFRRQFPNLDGQLSIPNSVDPTLTAVSVKTVLTDMRGHLVDNSKGIAVPKIYVAPNSSAYDSSLSYTLAGQGELVTIPTSTFVKLDTGRNGACFGLEIADLGYNKILTDADGNYLTDGDGKILLGR